MRKTILILITAFILAIILIRGFLTNGLTFSDQNHIVDHLIDQKPSHLEFICSGDLYDTLRQNDFRELYRLLAHAGVDYRQAGLFFSNSLHFISLRNLRYRDLPNADCFSMDDVRRSIRDMASARSDFLLLVTEELFTRLEDGKDLSRFAAENGIESYASTYISSIGIVEMNDLKYFAEPYAAVKDHASFSQAVAEFARQGADEFVIIFEPDGFNKITGNNEDMTLMVNSSILDTYKASYSQNSCVFHFTDVTYIDTPREICQSAENVSGVIRRMGTDGIRNFEIFFPKKSVFEDLCTNNFSLLYNAEAQGGMVSADLSYDRSSARLIFRNAEIVPDAVILNSLSDAIAYTEKLSAEGQKDIHLFCTPELYELLLGDENKRDDPDFLTRIYDLIIHAGIFDYDISLTGATHVISIRINSLFPGKAALLAARNGDESSLSEREIQVLKSASEIAAAAKDPDPLLTAKSVHDWICKNVSYTEDETTDDDDTAIGAILNGKANCDGYSDAFYLIGSLAGANIRYQHGGGLDMTLPDTQEPVSHVWNLLETDGHWHIVDVTWDDEPDGWTYIWFNAGRDIAGRMHVWNEDMTVEIAEQTDWQILGSRLFHARSSQDLWDAMDAAETQRLSGFFILLEDPSLSVYLEDIKNAAGERITGPTLTWSWTEKMSLLGFYDLQWR